MSLEEDFPGLGWEIQTLRKNGLDDGTIQRAIAARANFHKQAGYSGEAVDAWLKGRPGPIGLKIDKDFPIELQKDKYEKLKAFDEATKMPAGVDPMTGRRQGMLDKIRGLFAGSEPSGLKQPPKELPKEGPTPEETPTLEGPTLSPVSGAPKTRPQASLNELPPQADRGKVFETARKTLEEFFPGKRAIDVLRDPELAKQFEDQVAQNMKPRTAPLEQALQQESPPPPPKAPEQPRNSRDIYWGAVKKAAGADDVSGVLVAGGRGFAKGMLDAAAASGKTLATELQEAPEQFVKGLQRVWSGEGLAEKGMGALETVLAPVRAASAPFTAITKPTYERAVKPMLGLGDDPTTQMVGETILGLPFMGIGGLASKARMTGEAKEVARVAGELPKGETAMASLRKKLAKGDIPEGNRPTVEALSRLAGEAPEEAVSGPTPSATEQPSSGVKPRVVQQGTSLTDAAQAPADAPTPTLKKIEGPEGGPVTVVDETPGGETIVTRMPEDVGAATAQRVDVSATVPETVAPTLAPSSMEAQAGFSVEQAKAVVAQTLVNKQGKTIEEAKAIVDGLSDVQAQVAAQGILREYRIATGEITGKRGRPRQAEALQLGQHREVQGFDTTLEAAGPEAGIAGEMQPRVQSLQERARATAGGVRLPGDEPTTKLGDVGLVTFGNVRKLADTRGMEIVNQKGKIYLFKPGGEPVEFSSLRDAQMYLTTQEAKAAAPLEVRSPTTGTTTFETALKSEPLTGEQRAQVQAQKAVAAKSMSELGVPSWDFTLKADQVIGVTQPYLNRNEAMKAFAAARKMGKESRLVKNPDGQWEVMYYDKLSDEVNQAITLYRQALKNPDAVSPEDIAKISKALGGQGKAISGGSDVGAFRSMMNRLASRVSTDREGEGALRFANPSAGGMVSGDPLIRSATTELNWAERAFDHRMKGFGQVMKDLRGLVPDSERAMAIKEGTITPGTPEEDHFLDMATSLTKDFAKRAREQGMLKFGQELENYAPHNTDMSAIWDAFRDTFGTSNARTDLPPQMSVQMTDKQFLDYKAMFDKHVDWKTVPRDLMKRVKNDLFDFSDVASTWDALPQFIKDRMPKELFTKYFLSRSDKGIPYEKDFYKGMEQYIERVESTLNFTPWLEKYQPIIAELPGSGMMFTQRGFLEKLANNAILRRPTWDEATTNAFLDRVNLALGKDFFKTQDVNAASQLIRNGFMKGALGPDSALVNLSQMLYSWAENGKLVGPLFKYIQKGSQEIPEGIMSEFMNVFEANDKIGQSWLRKILEWDRKLTKIVLSPMSFTEHVNRGIAFYSGYEQALQEGKNGVDALQVGMARASSIVPNLEMTEAQMAAFESVVRTQLGQTPATRAPLFGGKGPLTRISTMLASFPAHTLQFLQTGVRQGFADALLKNEPSKLLRFTALTGFIVGVPYVAHKMGADMTNMFGPQAMLPLISTPLISGIVNAGQAVSGNDPLKREAAWNEFKKFAGTMTIPGFRYGNKVWDVWGNIERGHAIDKRGRYLYETTEYGELMRLAGINPEKAYDTRQMSRTFLEQSHQYRLDKQKAVDGILDGDYGPAKKFMSSWSHQLTSEDLQRAMQERQTTPEMRALKSVPPDIRMQMMMKQQQGR